MCLVPVHYLEAQTIQILYLGNVEEEEFTDGLGDILGTIPTEVEMCKVKIYRITSDKSIIKPSLRLF